MVPTEPKNQGAPRSASPNPVSDYQESQVLVDDLEAAGHAPLARDPKKKGEPLGKTAARWTESQALHAIRGVAYTLASNLDARRLVKEILDTAIQTLGAERGVLFLGRGTGGGLVPVVALSISGEELEGLERVSRTVLRRGQNGEVLVVEDVASDPRFKDVPSLQLDEIRSVLCAPLCTGHERIGVIYLDTRSGTWALGEHTEQFLEVFTRIAAASLENARLHGEVVQESERLRRSLDSKEPFRRVLAASACMEELLRRAALAAQVETPVLIQGESGTGKELLARAIYEASPRALQPFVVQNCASVPRDLMESLFFGHIKGSFTGAVRDSLGLLREADRGVLFLDEIADLDYLLQAKLLRVLEDGLVRPVGARKDYKVDIHLISATSRDLRKEVRQNRFREELFHRINVLELWIPPLRERVEDIPLLLDHFLRKHSDSKRGRPRVTFTLEAIEFLQTRPWPGNVRELENLVRRVVVLADRSRVDPNQLKRFMSVPQAAAFEAAVPPEGGEIKPFLEHERRIIRDALIRTGWNKSKAARLLTMTRGKLLRRIAKLGISPDGP